MIFSTMVFVSLSPLLNPKSKTKFFPNRNQTYSPLSLNSSFLNKSDHRPPPSSSTLHSSPSSTPQGCRTRFHPCPSSSVSPPARITHSRSAASTQGSLYRHASHSPSTSAMCSGDPNIVLQPLCRVQTGLVQMYSNCGFLVEAAKVFDEMPDRSTVTWNVFITGLIKWGEVGLAHSVFDLMSARSIVSWTLVIDGYTRTNQSVKAFTLFRKMVQVDGIEPTEVTLLTIFPAIANLGSIKICQSVHGYAEKRGFNAFDIRITNALIDLYAKCGCIESASRLFREIPDHRKNSVSWTSVMSVFAMNGMGREAVESFEIMEKAGLRPNAVTFLSVLSACSHGGLVEEGLKFFNKMVNDYQLVPDIKHYGCLIDMLGRAGRVTMKILEIERGHGGDYVLMSNILTGAGRFKDAERIREMLDKRIAFKLPGCSVV
ncbi:hypothetical protein RIF29_20136 [Crotalaria pallida]|uniref:Pentatricopeptide repeat protein n=1 Tax=Crotalaria pallida TaxID=3830 RepID=A0AAN9F128_CROPI